MGVGKDDESLHPKQIIWNQNFHHWIKFSINALNAESIKEMECKAAVRDFKKIKRKMNYFLADFIKDWYSTGIGQN